jgi:hypothetical protein
MNHARALTLITLLATVVALSVSALSQDVREETLTMTVGKWYGLPWTHNGFKVAAFYDSGSGRHYISVWGEWEKKYVYKAWLTRVGLECPALWAGMKSPLDRRSRKLLSYQHGAPADQPCRL